MSKTQPIIHDRAMNSYPISSMRPILWPALLLFVAGVLPVFGQMKIIELMEKQSQERARQSSEKILNFTVKTVQDLALEMAWFRDLVRQTAEAVDGVPALEKAAADLDAIYPGGRGPAGREVLRALVDFEAAGQSPCLVAGRCGFSLLLRNAQVGVDPSKSPQVELPDPNPPTPRLRRLAKAGAGGSGAGSPPPIDLLIPIKDMAEFLARAGLVSQAVQHLQDVLLKLNALDTPTPQGFVISDGNRPYYLVFDSTSWHLLAQYQPSFPAPGILDSTDNSSDESTRRRKLQKAIQPFIMGPPPPPPPPFPFYWWYPPSDTDDDDNKALPAISRPTSQGGPGKQFATNAAPLLSWKNLVDGQNIAPVADAGRSRIVPSGCPAVLDGSASYDPDNQPQRLRYQWRQTAGLKVSLRSDGPLCHATFPSLTGEQRYVFELTVSDGNKSGSSTVTVTVR